MRNGTVHGILCQETTLVDAVAERILNWFRHVSRMEANGCHLPLLYQWEKKPRKTMEEMDGQCKKDMEA